MRPLVVFFNELSSFPTEADGELEGALAHSTRESYAALREACKVNHTLRVRLPSEHWHSTCNAKTLETWFCSNLKREEYRWFLSRLQRDLPFEVHEKDVYVNGAYSRGLTQANVFETWGFSLPTSPIWHTHEIEGRCKSLEGGALVEVDCRISHISMSSHVEHWSSAIKEFGKSNGHTNVIARLNGMPIEMYPGDHGYPHVHLVHPTRIDADNHPLTLAKYRIDKFERIEGDPQWNDEMRRWVETNRAHLLANWALCQEGRHPQPLE